MMYVARILYPVRVLGPGDRIGIWFAGCEHHCKGCSNPELWDTAKKYMTSGEILKGMLARVADDHPIDGFTLTGGDPFFQPEALRELLPILQEFSTDILVYTGYMYEDLQVKYPDILERVAVLIDGPYIEERNNNCSLRGSDNQRIIYHDDAVREKYEDYLSGHTNRIQNFRSRDGVISVGIHRSGYHEEFQEKMKSKGVLTDG